MKIGQRLRELRKARGLKQFELAELADVDEKYITRWECDRVLPDLENAQKLAAALKVPVENLTERRGQ